MKKSLKALTGLIVAFALATLLFLYWPLYQRSVPTANNDTPVDVVLIGGGIMSITLGTYLQELQPDWKIELFERLNGIGMESSDGWNNAGTGHSAFAELNYTPELQDGTIETKRAIKIAEQFEISRQFWSYQVHHDRLPTPSEFITPTPHMSFVWGEDRIEYLRKRHNALIKNPLFYGMQFSTNPTEIQQWAPLLMEGRPPNQKVAATYMPLGTDVNFGVITRSLAKHLQQNPNFTLRLRHEVTALRQNADKTWNVTVKDLISNQERTIKSRFVFIGAGGAALKLLQMSGIPESKDYAGFPVGGQFLAFENAAITQRHNVKAYGMAETGSPPMSVPHLDARKLDGKSIVLFGPFALYSTKFLKDGSWFDLYSSINHHNAAGMLSVGEKNLDLVKYLLKQARLSDADRHAELLKYFPNAKPTDWTLVTAGQRVQVIKRDPEKGMILQFGTEIVIDKARTIAALLGASPGASTSPPIMLDLLAKAFPQQMKDGWETQLKNIIPSYGQHLNDSVMLTNRIRRMTSETLSLPYLEVPDISANRPAPTAAPKPQHSSTHNANSEMQAL
ncbi:malate dehydrogenase (quinone) [Xylella taiwanensis]|uniref:Probable malate:quinone oxidoreductase n=1 Tax=Xylella taiwanensis TaxID=1444770 RepID=A0ABS8TU31_9GAMM|nr:malate dehydrogenase (quinone) [Xylella taiwanensis]MCD8457338.1 malate dehydrogenase (quinone) [Xylella taiwanensis]MCD8459750.1 malate dehydrogenase (quinone) [Xylella taiwanensis]MCD8461381.1 malate dehydrogenase (quinone) [Xylella taiwanensis]MCD8462588.1 malate dehydrogenase (quinone) [Xylella taiwanensis]MCD8466374.1 malate dehydrogenase (quinone) [Xylella taiwanensis]